MKTAAALGLIQRLPRKCVVATQITAPLPVRYGTAGLTDNRACYFAQSALTGLPMRDGGPAPLLPVHQAHDVLRWAHGAAAPH